MENRIYNNADSFAMAFDETWPTVDCEDISLKIDKVIAKLNEHPFVIDNPTKVKQIADFRVNSLKKFM